MMFEFFIFRSSSDYKWIFFGQKEKMNEHKFIDFAIHLLIFKLNLSLTLTLLILAGSKCFENFLLVNSMPFSFRAFSSCEIYSVYF